MELQAPSDWKLVDFISDLHLHASDLLTFEAWKHYLNHTAADAVFILGDLFEVWLGDDAAGVPDSFEFQCVQVLREASKNTHLYLMHGNRDFLMGESLMQASHCTMLKDPSVFTMGGQRWLLSHGDALCLDDTAYIAFRETVRSASWQSEFLSQSLGVRRSIARNIRNQSEARKQTDSAYADVDSQAAIKILMQTGATTLIHGHTHRPANHWLGPAHQRIVLSDWDLSASPPRAEVLRLSAGEQGKPATAQRISSLSAAPNPAG